MDPNWKVGKRLNIYRINPRFSLAASYLKVRSASSVSGAPRRRRGGLLLPFPLFLFLLSAFSSHLRWFCLQPVLIGGFVAFADGGCSESEVVSTVKGLADLDLMELPTPGSGLCSVASAWRFCGSIDAAVPGRNGGIKTAAAVLSGGGDETSDVSSSLDAR